MIALDLEYEIGVEQGADLCRILASANPFQKLPCNCDILLTAHSLAP
jgi:hypothetical protein